jgi:hypothetical protein
MSYLAPELLDAVVTILRRYPAGVSLPDIQRYLDPQPDEPTLGEWLAALIKQRRIVEQTTHGITRYVVADQVHTNVSAAAKELAAASPANDQPPATASSADLPAKEELYAQCLPQVVISLLPRDSATAFFQQRAMFAGVSLDSSRAFVTYALRRLDTLTLQAAENFGLTRRQYELWHKQYAPPSPPVSPSPSPAPATESHPDSPVKVTKPAKRRRSRSPSDVTPTSVGDSATILPKVIDAWLRWLAPDLSPGARLALGSAIATLLVGLVSWASRYPWLLIALPLVGIGAWQLMRSRVSVPTTELAAGLPTTPSVNVAPLATWMSRHVRSLAIGGLALGAVIAGGLWYRSTLRYPSADAVSSFLTTESLPLPVRVAALEVAYGDIGTLGTRVTYQALMETTEPLYRRLDTFATLRSQFATEMSAIDAADKLLRSSNGDRVRTALAASPATVSPSPSLQDVILLAVETPPKTTALAAGTLLALRRDGAWKFTVEQGGFARSRLPGDPRPPTGSLFIVDEVADEARLKSLLADHVAYAAKVQETARRVALEAREETGDRNQGIVDRSQVTVAPAVRRLLPEPPPNDTALAAREQTTVSQLTARPADRLPNNVAPARQSVADPPAARLAPVVSAPSSGGRAGTPLPANRVAYATEVQAAAPKAEPPSPPPPSEPQLQHVSLSAFPHLPSALGAYVLADGHWLPLPTNEGRIAQTTEQALAMVETWDNHPGTDPAKAPVRIAADLTFDGTESVPAVPAKDVVILYVGPAPELSSDQLERYPELQNYPLIELVALKTIRRGIRVAPLYAFAPGILGRGSRRIDASIEHPGADLTVLRCKASLSPGRYGLWLGPKAYELAVR